MPVVSTLHTIFQHASSKRKAQLLPTAKGSTFGRSGLIYSHQATPADKRGGPAFDKTVHLFTAYMERGARSALRPMCVPPQPKLAFLVDVESLVLVGTDSFTEHTTTQLRHQPLSLEGRGDQSHALNEPCHCVFYRGTVSDCRPSCPPW